mgnify:CR=1 FL=1
MRIFYNQSVDAIARRLIPGIAVAALAAWGVASGGAVLEDIPELTSKAQAANLGSGSAVAAADAGSWQDGTWTGTAQGYGGDVTVSVTIANKKITAIEVVSASAETPSFFSRAKAIIPKIIEAQNPDVDVVSGATYSSNGIINAVKNALTKASGGTVTETSNGGAASNAAGSTSSDAFQDGTYKDGTYTGSAAGFRGNITVSVTISGGKIASISVVSAPGNDEPYLSKAKTLIAKVLAKQSPNGVDTVSGATYSSNGILNAIKNALTKAAGGTVSETPNSGGTTGGDTSPSKLDKDTYTGTYKDGTYTGTGKGYKGTVTAKVTISGGKIKTIDVSGSDDAAYFSKAKNGIVSKIISGQSTNVDTVSGATYSSNGIISAVRNALKKAQTTGGTTTDDEDKKDEKTYTDTKTEFYGIGYGYRNGRIVLKVTASGGALKSIDVIEKNDQDDDYFNDAMEIVEKVKNGKNINVVDTVSGATYSSKGILTALTEALNKAVIAGQYTPPKETPDTPDTPEPTPEGKTYTETATVTPVADEDGEFDFEAYDLLVDVTVQDGKVTSVSLNASNGYGSNAKQNKRYSDKAVKMELTGKTASDIDGVDTITGATCSSKAIKQAVKQALAKAEG